LFIAVVAISTNVLGRSITALSGSESLLLRLTGFACVVSTGVSS